MILTRTGVLVALVAVAVAAAGCAETATRPGATDTDLTATVSPTALQSLGPCAQLPDLPTARCGTVSAPLDREHPAKGSVAVAFALVPHSDTSKPGLGTVVPNPGGPGTSTIDLAGGLFSAALSPLLDRRDLLLVDTRGSGRSGALSCPALDGSARAFAGMEEQRALIGECGRQLGEHAGDYSTAAMADDIDDVRARLGLDRLDLLGVSFGTFLMPVYAQRHPTHVRTVTLASAYAVNGDTGGAVGAAAFRRAVGLVCLRTGTCDGGQVLSDLTAVLHQLREHPEPLDVEYDGTVHHMTLDEWQLTSTAGMVYSGKPDTDTELALARAAAAGRAGDLQPVRDLVRADILRLAESYSTAGIASDADNWANMCHDYAHGFDYSDSVADRTADHDAGIADLKDADFAPFTAAAWTQRATYDSGACLQWPDDPTAGAPFPVGAALPDVPVFVLTGDLDANTPTDSGRAAAAQFPHATVREFAGAGHSPASTPEGAAAIVGFIGG